MGPGLVIRARPLAGSVECLSENLLAADEHNRLRKLATLLEYRRGQTVCSQGQKARYIHFIGSGTVRVFRTAERGKRQIMYFSTAGDLCGLPDAGNYVNSAETVSAARIYRVSWQLFLQLMLAAPRLQGVFLRKVTADFHRAQSRIMMMGQENILHRVATFLTDMMAITQFFDSEQSLLYLPMNRFDVADHLGMCPETTARALTKLEHMGIIRRITPRQIEIIDTARLRLMQQEPRYGNREMGPPPASLELGFRTHTTENTNVSQ